MLEDGDAFYFYFSSLYLLFISFFVRKRLYQRMVRFTSCIIIFGILSPLIIADPCRFEDSTKGVIDISSLGRTDGTAAFPDLIPTNPSGWSRCLSCLFIMII
jgi:hypothetical protein